MIRSDAIASQLMRAGAIMRDLDLALRRVDEARKKLGTGKALSELADELVVNVESSATEKYVDILTRINSWMAVEISGLNRAASIIEKEIGAKP